MFQELSYGDVSKQVAYIALQLYRIYADMRVHVLGLTDRGNLCEAAIADAAAFGMLCAVTAHNGLTVELMQLVLQFLRYTITVMTISPCEASTVHDYR